MRKKLGYFLLFFIFNLFLGNNLIIPKVLSEEKKGDFNYLDKNFNSESYILGPGDKIQLQFASGKQFDGIFRILNDGTLTLPIIGRRYVEN